MIQGPLRRGHGGIAGANQTLQGILGLLRTDPPPQTLPALTYSQTRNRSMLSPEAFVRPWVPSSGRHGWLLAP